MKTETIYKCDYCNCTSNNPDDILFCEAKHFGFSIKQKNGDLDRPAMIKAYNAYNSIYSLAKYCRFLTEQRNRNDAMHLYIRTINDMIQFEEENHINEDLRYSKRKEFEKPLKIESATVNVMGTTHYYECGHEVNVETGFGYKDEDGTISWYSGYNPGVDDEFHFTEIEDVK